MNIAIHKKKLYKRYKLPREIIGTHNMRDLLLEEIKREIDSGSGYELVQKHDFIGDKIESRECDIIFQKEDYIVINGEPRRIEEVVHMQGKVVYVIDDVQEEEDEETIQTKEHILTNIDFLLNFKVLSIGIPEVVEKSEVERKKRWWEKIIS